MDFDRGFAALRHGSRDTYVMTAGGFHDCDFGIQCAGPLSARILIHGHRMSRIDLPLSPPPDCEPLRADVRDFIAAHRHRWSPTDRARSWMSYDRDLSLALGARGWIGMTWPKAYGGRERSAIERYTVL